MKERERGGREEGRKEGWKDGRKEEGVCVRVRARACASV